MLPRATQIHEAVRRALETDPPETIQDSGIKRVTSVVDIAWAAGFLEGEGNFGVKGNGVKGGRRRPEITAVQVQRAPLERLQKIFGGTINKRIGKGGRRQDFYVWRICSTKAIELAMTIYSQMSPRRQKQMTVPIELWKVPTPPHFQSVKTHCPKGHPYSQWNLVNHKNGKRRRTCKLCLMHRGRRVRYLKKVPSSQLRFSV